MKLNVGGLDKMLRVVAGVLLIAAAVTGYFTPWGWIGIIPLVTGLVGWCPAYAIFGINSCPLSKGE
ncbi:MAG: DUF2892 domain-containing protein [Alphaproteobacteria bacterium]|uniref:Inner membrane protein YgaP-like transmembrane domain-containing protein n=1 Tax=hydrothermal vent metagenome TaxID=652676 RepID=A0A3B0RJ11_9ZZZZ|nr:DUF2892 domain-containing protein [Alphaproteobacteria bacterium]PCJ43277.1 MAG: hypothetical protein COA81_04340 [Alphaproteobacteria bacterium]